MNAAQIFPVIFALGAVYFYRRCTRVTEGRMDNMLDGGLMWLLVTLAVVSEAAVLLFS